MSGGFRKVSVVSVLSQRALFLVEQQRQLVPTYPSGMLILRPHGETATGSTSRTGTRTKPAPHPYPHTHTHSTEQPAKAI
jgi:hypothetical protein